MDTELSEIKQSIARIDERTTAILENQERQDDDLEAHAERDRQDFKEVHHRITNVEKKQQWIVGLGTAVIFGVTLLAGIIKGFFG